MGQTQSTDLTSIHPETWRAWHLLCCLTQLGVTKASLAIFAPWFLLVHNTDPFRANRVPVKGFSPTRDEGYRFMSTQRYEAILIYSSPLRIKSSFLFVNWHLLRELQFPWNCRYKTETLCTLCPAPQGNILQTVSQRDFDIKTILSSGCASCMCTPRCWRWACV